MILFSDYVKIPANTQYPLISVVGTLFDNQPDTIRVYTNRGVYNCNYDETSKKWIWTGTSADGFSSITISVSTTGNRQILYITLDADYEGSLTVIDPSDEGQFAQQVLPLLPQFSDYPDFENDDYDVLLNKLYVMRAELYGLLKALQDMNTQDMLKQALNSIQYNMPYLNVYDTIFAHSVVYAPFKLSVNPLEKWDADAYSYPTLSEQHPFDFIGKQLLKFTPFIFGEAPAPEIPDSDKHYFIISDEPIE